jgi:hypothetical protein
MEWESRRRRAGANARRRSRGLNSSWARRTASALVDACRTHTINDAPFCSGAYPSMTYPSSPN